MVRHERIQELERTVIDRQADNAHVVCIHDTVTKTHALPLGNQGGGVSGHARGECIHLLVDAQILEIGEIGVYRGVKQRSQRLRLAVVGEVFKVPESQKGRGRTGHDGGCLYRLASHRRVGGDQCQGTACWDTQSMHRFAAEVLADTATQDGTSISHA